MAFGFSIQCILQTTLSSPQQKILHFNVVQRGNKVTSRQSGIVSSSSAVHPSLTREREYGALDRSQYSLFVQFFRQATPYIEGHRGRTFVLVLPGEIVDNKPILHRLLEDVALMHSLGVKLVIVIGARTQIDAAIKASGGESTIVSGLRITDGIAMSAAIEAAGKARLEIEARLSRGPAVNAVRRHTRGGQVQVRNGPALQTVSGNYVAAKRRGVVKGVDYQFTGSVRFVQADAVRRQLDAGSVVLLSNLGYSAAGEVLNCNIFDVGVRAAADLKADKLIMATLPDALPPGLSAWMPLHDAQRLLLGNGSNRTCQLLHEGDSDSEMDMDRWHEEGASLPLVAACLACKAGVKRAHLIDANVDGALLLELYSRDGVGTMISTDFYEGIRAAATQDLDGLQELLKPLEDAGILVARTREQLAEELPLITVLERESRVLGCATVRPLGADAFGLQVAELAAFAVHPSYRGGGKGDSLLEYLEGDARSKGANTLVLLTTRTADWFEQRGFKCAGAAHTSDVLPESRRVKINPARNSQLYVKNLK